MNPFTKAIAARMHSRRLHEFIQRWDALEALVVRVYRGNSALATDQAEYAQLRSWLTRHYPAWQAKLEPYWRQALQGGQPSANDPFVFLLTPERANDFLGSWVHMQTLPAAREALNRLILETRD